MALLIRARTILATPYRRALAGALLLYVALLGTLSSLRHATYHSSLIDLGIFDQVVWNTAHGRWFWDTLDPFVQRNHVFLGQHFSPGLLVLVPFYLVIPSVYTLLWFQTLALALGAIPLYLLAARRTGDEWIALLLALAYLLYPSLAYANLFDFHEIALAVPLLGWAVERFDAGRSRPAVMLLCLALLMKEEVGLIVAAFGLFVFLAQGRRWLGSGLITLGIGWTAAVIYIAVPLIRGGPYLFTGRYQGGLLESGHLNLTYLGHFLSWPKIEYLLLLLGPLLFLPLGAGWMTILLAPTIAYTVLSTYSLQFDIHYHYASPLIPLLFASTVYALQRMPSRWQRPLATLVLALVIGSAWLVGPLPGAREFHADTYRMGPKQQAMAHVVSLVPRGVVLAVDNQMGAHLTQRVWVTHFFTGYEHAQALLFDISEASATPDKRRRALATIAHDPSLRLVAHQDGIFLYVRRGTE